VKAKDARVFHHPLFTIHNSLERRRGLFMNLVVQDLKYGLRVLGKNPGFTAVAVLTLALGIGANTAIFSVVNGVLLQPLPYKDPGRLVVVGERTPEFDMMSLSYPNFVDWREQSRSFEGIAAFNWQDYNLTGAGDPEHLSGKRVSAGFFSVFGIPPILGRDFDPNQDRVGASPVVMISGGLWKRRFGMSADAVGKRLTLDGQGYTIIGVIPASFQYRGSADVYTLLGQWDDIQARLREVHPGIHAVARLKPDVTVAQAQSEMSNIAARLAQAYPKSNAHHGATVRPMAQELVGNVRPALLVLLGAVGFVLLIACSNVANLLLARSTARQREMAVRAAIGASQARLIRQLLTESVLLALAGGALGLLLASYGTDAVVAAVPGGLPRMESITIDGWVLAFTLAVSLFTGLVFGLAPALQVSHTDPHTTLKEGGRDSTAGHHGLRAVLVVSEIAASLVLLVGAGLMLNTMWQLSRVDPGFDPRHLLTFSVGLSPVNRSSPDKIRLAYQQLTEAIQGLPGVGAAAVTQLVPLGGDDTELPFWVIGRPRPPTQSEMLWALLYCTSPGYLHAMGIPLLRGRYFTDQDTKDLAGVVVIDEVMAQSLFSGEDALGKSIAFADLTGEVPGFNKPRQIVGIVGHVKHWGLDSDAAAKIRYQLYWPYVQIPDQLMTAFSGGVTLMVRATVDPFSMVTGVRRRVAETGRDQPVYNVQTMQQIVSDSVADRRFSMLLLGIFAALALVLAWVGVYGVISYTASQRTHEIGIRMALGAGRADVLRLVLGQGLALILIGVGIGLAAALGLTRLMSSMLYGVRPTDLLTFGVVALVLAGVAVLASYIPARRAAKVDPVVALRYE
jgi:predicted permease